MCVCVCVCVCVRVRAGMCVKINHFGSNFLLQHEWYVSFATQVEDIKSKLDLLIEMWRADTKRRPLDSAQEEAALDATSQGMPHEDAGDFCNVGLKVMQRHLSDPRHTRRKHLNTARSFSKLPHVARNTLKEEIEVESCNKTPKPKSPSSTPQNLSSCERSQRPWKAERTAEEGTEHKTTLQLSIPDHINAKSLSQQHTSS